MEGGTFKHISFVWTSSTADEVQCPPHQTNVPTGPAHCDEDSGDIDVISVKHAKNNTAKETVLDGIKQEDGSGDSPGVNNTSKCGPSASDIEVINEEGDDDTTKFIKEENQDEDDTSVASTTTPVPTASCIDVFTEIDDKTSVTKAEIPDIFVSDDITSPNQESLTTSTPTNSIKTTDNGTSPEHQVLVAGEETPVGNTVLTTAVLDTSESSNGLLDCTLCDFQAFTTPQLESHKLWHKTGDENWNNAVAFRCPYCPCVVSTFADFRFHAQFHKRGVVMKYFECSSCTFRCDSEDIMGMHYITDQATRHEKSGNDGGPDPYIVKELEVTFHTGCFACPMELCGESFHGVEAVLEHCIREHEPYLAGKHLLDFYECPQLVRSLISEKPVEEAIEDMENEVLRFLCEICGFATSFISELNQHVTGNHQIASNSMTQDNTASECSKTETNRSSTSASNSYLTMNKSTVDFKGRNDAISNTTDPQVQRLDMNICETDKTGCKSKNNCNGAFENGLSSEMETESSDTNKSSSTQPTNSKPDDLTCDLCRHLIDFDDTRACQVKQHRRFHVRFSGGAFQCGYCSYLADVKETIALHLTLVHVDAPIKVRAVKIVNGKIMSKETVNLKACRYRYYMPSIDDTRYELDLILEEVFTRPFSSNWGLASENQDTDEPILSRHDQAFCRKVNGMELFRCNVCSFVSELISSVRVHYVAEHRYNRPLLCAWCCTRVSLKSFRKHHLQHHADHALVVIRTVYANNGAPSDTLHDQPELLPREYEITEELDASGNNDWHAAILNLCSKRQSENVLICHFCEFQSNNPEEMSRHVLPNHFRRCPLVCHYCSFGSVLLSSMKWHMMKYHSALPFRIRRQLPIQPTEKQILHAKQTQNRKLAPAYKSFEESKSSKDRKSQTKKKRSSTNHDSSDKEEEKERAQITDTEEDSQVHRIYTCLYCGHTCLQHIHYVRHHILCFHLVYRRHNCDYCLYGSRSLSCIQNHLKEKHPTLPCSHTHISDFKAAIHEMMEAMGHVVIVALFNPDGKPVMKIEYPDGRLCCEYVLQQKENKDPKPVETLTLPTDSLKETESLGASTPTKKIKKKRIKKRKKGPPLPKPVVPLKSCFQCKLCGESNPILAQLKYHIIVKHWKLHVIMCPLCEFGDCRRLCVDQHMRTSHPGSNLKPQNIKSFRHTELKQLVIEPEEPVKKRTLATSNYACTLCSHVTHDHFIMRRHVMIHMKYEPFRCPHCDLSSVEKYQIKTHMAKKHKDSKGAPLTIKDMEKELEIENNIRKVSVTSGEQQQCVLNNVDKSDNVINENDEIAKETEGEPPEEVSQSKKRKLNVTESKKCPHCEFKTTSKRHFNQHVYVKHKLDLASLMTPDKAQECFPPDIQGSPRKTDIINGDSSSAVGKTKGTQNKQKRESHYKRTRGNSSVDTEQSLDSLSAYPSQPSSKLKLRYNKTRANSPVDSDASDSSIYSSAPSSPPSKHSARRNSDSSNGKMSYLSDRTMDDLSDASSVAAEPSSEGKRDLVMCCFACSYRTRAEINLLAHIQLHRHFTEKIECRFCEFVTKERCEFESHVQLHVRSRPYRCSRCSSCFKLRRKALDHCARVHAGRRKARVEQVEIIDNTRRTFRRERKRQLNSLHVHPAVFLFKDFK